MWYYVKQSFISFIYLFFTAIIAFGIMCIDSDLAWLRIILLVLNLGLYVVIVAAASFKDGQEALKVRIANDLERLQIIRTGEALPLKLREEYKPWKGFISGAISCIPLIVLLIVHTILIFAAGKQYIGAGAIASFIYMMVFAFARCTVPTASESAVAVAPDPFMHYWSLLVIPVIILSTGIPYILGARKIELQQQRIKEKQRQIYGE